MSQASYKTRMLESFRSRMYGYVIGVVGIFVLLLSQLVNLQLIQGATYRQKAKSNMENYIPIAASRGEMYDRNFSTKTPKGLIVSNRPSFNLTIVPAQVKTKAELKKTIENFCKITGQNSRELLSDISKKNRWERIVLLEDASFDTVVKVASFPHELAHIEWEDVPVRIYNKGNSFVHATGYIGSISRKEYRRLKREGYKPYQKIGKTGIEYQFDSYLRGTDGFVRRIVDVRNRTEGEIVGKRPIPGNNLILTLDYEVQLAAHTALENLKGSVIVMKPATGEILALVSKPDFDPNLIISRKNQKLVLNLYNNPDKPFLNRAIQSKYPPASTFKLVTAIAGLETEKATPEKTYYCSGKFTLKGLRNHDFYCFATHGRLDLTNAIAQSCSVYFYQYGLNVGPTSILKYAKYFGLAEKTGIDIPGEIAGFIPSKRWKHKAYGQPWYDGDTVNLSIGQGFLAVTPIAMANLTAGIVNNGIMYKPHLVKQILSPSNDAVVITVEAEKLRELPLSPLTLNTIRKGMRLSVLKGSATRLRHFKVPLTGKTGTAQTRSKRKELSTQHGWYVGYGPYEGKPEDSVVVVVMVEYGISGATTAVPVAEKVYKKLIELGYLK